ncbi:uncharacterized protein LOC141674645 [Apium graveolens]|uniref:uncharacterized protein LOC141674645 n=1 Tax=Apium graveolens TaxID=4045 RepID=UPI003D7A28F5
MDQANDEDDDISLDSSDFLNHIKGEHQPLYPGSESYTKLKALVKLYNMKVKHDMSDSCFSDVLLLLGSMLSEGMGYEKIHACPNDCLLYRGQRNEDETTCHICKASRWKLNRKGEELLDTERPEDGKLWHPANSETWKDVDKKWPDFASESRNLRLALSSDGPTEPGNDIDVYLQPLIEDLQELWRGKNVYDAYQQESFILRLVNYRKTVTMRHRRWLPRHHPYRRQKSFFDNTVEKEVAPIPLTGEQAFKGYVRDPAHPEGCIAEAYVAEEAVECFVNFEEPTVGLPQNSRHEQDAMCRPLSGATMIKLSKEDLHQAFIQSQLSDDNHNIPEEIRWIAEGPNKIVPTFSGYKINAITYSTKERDDNRQVQCSGVCVVAYTMLVQGKDKNIEHISHTYYGVISSIWELDYNKFRIPLFRCNWVDMNKGVKVDDLGYTLVNLNILGYVNDPFILGKHVKQVCYIDDPLKKHWSVVLKLPEKSYYDQCDDENDGSVEIELQNELHVLLFPSVEECDEE